MWFRDVGLQYLDLGDNYNYQGGEITWIGTIWCGNRSHHWCFFPAAYFHDNKSIERRGINKKTWHVVKCMLFFFCRIQYWSLHRKSMGVFFPFNILLLKPSYTTQGHPMKCSNGTLRPWIWMNDSRTLWSNNAALKMRYDKQYCCEWTRFTTTTAPVSPRSGVT